MSDQRSSQSVLVIASETEEVEGFRYCSGLQVEGIEATCVLSRWDAFCALMYSKPDVIVLDADNDYMRLEDVKEITDAPVMVVDWFRNHAVDNLERGADEFVSKTAPLAELCARVKALIRSSERRK